MIHTKWAEKRPLQLSGADRRASVPPSQRGLRRLRRAPKRMRAAGAALVLALIAAAVMIGLAVALSARSFGGLLASVFGGDADQAREAAELGAARIQATLMKERNRGLLPLAPSGSVSWGSAQLSNANNPCAVNADRESAPDLNSIANGGATGISSISVSNGTAAPVVYVSNDGTATVSNDTTAASKAPANTRYAYQLQKIEVPTAASWTSTTGSPKGSPTRGQLTLQVKGYSYNSAGVISGSTVLEKTLEVVPKCCGLSLGGNNNSSIGNDNRNCNAQINDPGFGVLFGTDLTNDGSLSLSGVKSTVESLTDGAPVSPLVCRSSTTSTCPTSVKVGTADTKVVSTEFNINAPQQYIDVLSPLNPTARTWNITTTKGTTLCGNGATPGPTSFFSTYSVGSTTVCQVNPSSSTGLPSECGVVLNDQVSEVAIDGTRTTRTFRTVHCNILSLVNGNNQIWRFITSNTSRLILHFPSEGSKVLDINGFVEHCDFTSSSSTTCVDSPSVTSNPLLRLQLLGCQDVTNGTGCVDNAASPTKNSTDKTDTQGLTLVGNSTFTGIPYFLYFPIADLTVSGSGKSDGALAGVFWVNTIKGSGNVEISVPGSGIGDLLNQYTGGSGGSDDESEEQSAAPPILEYTLRAVQKFFFKPGA